MRTPSQSFSNNQNSKAEVIELHTTSEQSDKTSLIAKDNHSDLPPVRQEDHWWFRAWIFEMVSFTVAFVVFIVLIIVLRVFNGRPDPLLSFGITLNTITSVTSMTFRIGLMVPVASCISQLNWIWLSQHRRPLYDVIRFDQASRSPYGSVQLLFSRSIRSFASVGAIITALSLLVGPCFQQSLVFYGDLVHKSSAVSYVAFAPAFNPAIKQEESEWEGSFMPFNMKAAVYSGLFSSGATSLPVPPFNCPSGNCTWEPFSTLAIGAQCRDASELYHLKCLDEFSDPETCAFVEVSDDPKYTRVAQGNFTSSDRNNLFRFGATSTYSELDPAVWTIPTGEHFEFDWVRASDVQKVWVNPPSPQQEIYVARNSSIESQKCMLYTCLRVLLVSVQNGIYNETVLQESVKGTIHFNNETGPYYAYAPATPSSYNFTAQATNLTITSDGQRALLNTLRDPFGDFTGRSDGIKHILSGNLTMDSRGQLVGINLMQVLYRAPNLTEMVYNLAYYMSIAIRSMDTFADIQASRNNGSKLPKDYISPKEQVPGRVWVTSIHVRARLEWLILPGLLMMLAFVLLVATIIQTRYQRIGVWKENPLALLLFSTFDDQCKPVMDGARTEEDVRLAAEGLDVQLTVSAEAGSRGIKDAILIYRKADV